MDDDDPSLDKHKTKATAQIVSTNLFNWANDIVGRALGRASISKQIAEKISLVFLSSQNIKQEKRHGNCWIVSIAMTFLVARMLQATELGIERKVINKWNIFPLKFKLKIIQ